MEPTPRASGRATAVVAWAAAAVAVVLATAAAWLDRAGSAAGDEPAAAVRPVLLTAVFAASGMVLASRRPRLALGWLALGEALLFAVSAFAIAWIGSVSDGSGVDVAWAAWVADRFSALLAVGIWLLLILLPDGRLPSPRWRPVVGAVVGVQCLAIAAFATVRGPAAGPGSTLPQRALEAANPAALLPSRVGELIEGLDTVLLQVPLLLSLVAYGVRLRGAPPEERARVVGTLLAASTFVLLVVFGHAWWPQVSDVLDVVAAALLAAALTAMVLGRRPRVVAVAVRQTFLYTVLTLLVGGLAVLLAQFLRRFGSQQPDMAIAVLAGAVALAVHPLRTRLARLVDRLMYGDLHDPFRALQRLADSTHHAPSAKAVLDGLAATVAASLRLPWCAVDAAEHEGSWGERPPAAGRVTAPLLAGTTTLGTITVAAPDRVLSADEQRLLADLGRHGGLAVQAVLLSDAVRAGRQRLVLAREEERRRLRRDLHDGVGPTLAGLTMQLGTLRTLFRTQPDAAADRLGALQEAARGALDTVRRLAHGLRPPALDELGVVGALRGLTDALGLPARFPDPDPPRLPAATEVAVYLIAAEALHNVSRHAGAASVEVSVRVADGEVTVVVRDTGRGVDGAQPPGVGLAAMRERADELGGSLELGSLPGQGTTVTARLPAHEAETVVMT
jgi:two-component system NarL family sensor kinase